jgi:predicted GNAT family N-acyltransferase
MGMTIEVRPAVWRDDEATLSAIRRRVFIEEQSVPEALEWDGEDPFSRHWLACAKGEPIGTVRLLRDGHVGRMAVLAEWRRRGAGGALLRAVIDCARAESLRELRLHAQTHAIPFYRRFGFAAEGPEFMEAGIPHRSMRLALREGRRLGIDAGRFAVHDRAAALLDLAHQCQRHLRLFSESLDPELFDSDDFSAALSRIARGHRQSEVRLLIVDPHPLVERGHRLLALQRRLPSSIHLRKVGETPQVLREGYLIADQRGVVCFDQREPENAWGDYNNKPLAEDFRVRFDELWSRAEVVPELRLLAL